MSKVLAMWRYFSRRGDTSRKFTLSNGKFIEVVPIDRDLGVLAVAKESVVTDIQNAINRQAGGWEEISKEQYDALMAQKKTDLKPRWREEHSNAEMKRARPAGPNRPPESPGASVAADKPKTPPPTPVASEAFRPTASKRLE